MMINAENLSLYTLRLCGQIQRGLMDMPMRLQKIQIDTKNWGDTVTLLHGDFAKEMMTYLRGTSFDLDIRYEAMHQALSLAFCPGGAAETILDNDPFLNEDYHKQLQEFFSLNEQKTKHQEQKLKIKFTISHDGDEDEFIKELIGKRQQEMEHTQFLADKKAIRVVPNSEKLTGFVKNFSQEMMKTAEKYILNTQTLEIDILPIDGEALAQKIAHPSGTQRTSFKG